MFRIFGFVVGSALSVGALLLLLGVPEIENAQPVAEAEPARKVRIAALESPAAKRPLPEPSLSADELEPPLQLPDDDNDAPVRDPNWHAFWNPFRSEIAANGFVTQLERVTGLEYRVVKSQKGSYQVAFAYRDDAERLTKLSQIEAATGLDLPET